MKHNNKLYVIGHFAVGVKRFDGQTVKTRNVFNALVKKYSKEKVKIIDTYNWKKRPLTIFLMCIKAAKESDNILIIPSMNGLKIFIPLFVKLRKRYRFKIHHIAIGGWLYDFYKNNRRVINYLRKIDYIYVENHSVIKGLNSLGLQNVYYMPNFKNLRKSKKKKEEKGVKKCCIFSRITKKKGVVDAVDVINKYNSLHEDKVFLDIYGEIDDDFINEFNDLIYKNEYIKYIDAINPDESVRVIEKYDLLLFPTKHKTEGIPGTIIDAYFAGTPVLSSRWDNCREIVIEGETGFSYRFGDIDDFYNRFVLIKNENKLAGFSEKCLREAEKYSSDEAIAVLIRNIEEKRIALYIDSMHRGGAERVMSILANSFVDEGHKVVLMTDVAIDNENDYIVSEKIKCIHIQPISKGLLLKNIQRIKQLRKIIKNAEADVVLSFLGKQNYRMLFATFGLKCRKCVSVRNDPNREYGRAWFRRWAANKIFALADACVFQTEDARRYFNKKIQKKSTIIPNPVDERFFNVKRVKNPKNIVTVGRLMPQKNQKLLIDAFAAIVDKINDEKLLIYGDGPLKEELKVYIKKINMSDRIIMMGKVNEIEKELAKAKLFVLSSDYEGMPNALMEAMAVGVPCISTDCPCGGPKRLLKNVKNGILVSCNDASEMSGAILSLMNNHRVSGSKRSISSVDAVKSCKADKIICKWKYVLVGRTK